MLVILCAGSTFHLHAPNQFMLVADQELANKWKLNVKETLEGYLDIPS
jgi:hypothetical protein